jgi:hypothetical protein
MKSIPRMLAADFVDTGDKMVTDEADIGAKFTANVVGKNFSTACHYR